VDETTKALIEACEDLARYVRHRTHCQVRVDGEVYVCTCGLQEVRDKARGAIEEAKRESKQEAKA